jgi:hypothetical protein
VALVAAQTTTTQAAPKIFEKKGLIRKEILDLRPLIKEARQTPRDPRNECVSLKASNTGYAFKNAQSTDLFKVRRTAACCACSSA